MKPGDLVGWKLSLKVVRREYDNWDPLKQIHVQNANPSIVVSVPARDHSPLLMFYAVMTESVGWMMPQFACDLFGDE